MSRRVLLIAPPLSFEAPYPLRLAGVARALSDAGFEVRGIDMRRGRRSLASLPVLQGSAPPAMCVVEASIRNVASVRAVVDAVRGRLSRPVVVTGTAAAVAPRLFVGSGDRPGFADAAVTGDAEQVVPALAERLVTTGGLGCVEGAWVLVDGAEVQSLGGGLLEAERLPPVDRRVFPLDRYASHPLRPGHRYAAVEASRGCSLACSFCPVPRCPSGALRLRPIDDVVGEVERLRRDHAVDAILLEDDQPLLDRGWLASLLAALRQRTPGMTFELPNGLRPDLLDDDLLEELARSGFTRLALGIESGSERVRSGMGRQIDDGALRALIGRASSLGLVTTGYFMLGLPGEGPADRAATFRLSRSLPLHHAHLSICWPWNPPVEELPLPAARLTRLRPWSYLWTYGSPRRLLRLALSGELAAARAGTAASRFVRWARSGPRGGGGW